MGKFTLKVNTSPTPTTYVPEDNGWTWVSESIPEPITNYHFASKGMGSGYVDLSKTGAGALTYESRNIEVTFARFKKGADGWLDDVESTITSIQSIFNLSGQPMLYPKTISTKWFITNGFNWNVSRDGIIQYLTITFKCQPIGNVIH